MSKIPTEVDGIKVGDVFTCSWGYDQTNVDYAIVVRLTAKRVVIRGLPGKVVGYDRKAPNLDAEPFGEEEVKTVNRYGSSVSLYRNTYSNWYLLTDTDREQYATIHSPGH